MKVLDEIGLKHLLNRLKERLDEKTDKNELPVGAKFTGVKSGEEEPKDLNVGDEWHREKII